MTKNQRHIFLRINLNCEAITSLLLNEANRLSKQNRRTHNIGYAYLRTNDKTNKALQHEIIKLKMPTGCEKNATFERMMTQSYTLKDNQI